MIFTAFGQSFKATCGPALCCYHLTHPASRKSVLLIHQRVQLSLHVSHSTVFSLWMVSLRPFSPSYLCVQLILSVIVMQMSPHRLVGLDWEVPVPFSPARSIHLLQTGSSAAHYLSSTSAFISQWLHSFVLPGDWTGLHKTRTHAFYCSCLVWDHI